MVVLSSSKTDEAPKRARRNWMKIAVLIICTIVVPAGSIVVAHHLVERSKYTSNGVPLIQGSVGVEQLRAAQQDFFEQHGRYASNTDELNESGSELFRWEQHLDYFTISNNDGTAYVVASVGFTGGYFADFRSRDGGGGTGAGETLQDALQAAGWSPEWAAEKGFPVMPSVARHFGSIATDGESLTTIRDDDEGVFLGAVVPLSRAGSGSSWQEAVTSAGVSPQMYGDVIVTDKAETFLADDHSSTLTLSRRGDVVYAHVAFAPTSESLASDAIDAYAALEGAAYIDEPSRRFTCATASSETLASVTLCSISDGSYIAYTSAPRAARGDTAEEALENAGATSSWAQRNGLILPTRGDLF